MGNTKEKWADIKDYEGFYQVSDFGRVRSMDRRIRVKGYFQNLKGRILSPSKRGKYGHLGICLYRNGKVKAMYIHRLVAETFIGPCPKGLECCHGTNGHLDNSVSNLRWGSSTSNSLDMRRDKTNTGRPVLRSDGVKFDNLHIAAEISGCNVGNIWAVCNGRRKNHFWL